MKTRGSWGIVSVAAVFALIAVGTAIATYSFEKGMGGGDIRSAVNGFLDWRSVSDAPGTLEESGPPLTDAISQDLLEGYSALINKGEFTKAERDQMLAELVKKNVEVPAVVPTLTVSDLNTTATTLEKYTALIGAILKQSSSIKNYELNVFVAAMQSGTTLGVPELVNNASIYQKIALELLRTPTLPALAEKHLEAVKSVGALANIVALMGAWKGDPIEALVYLDTFNKTETYVTNSLNALFTETLALGKRT